MSRASTSEGSLVAFNTMLRQRQCSVSVTKLQAEAAPSALYCIVVSCHCLPASYWTPPASAPLYEIWSGNGWILVPIFMSFWWCILFTSETQWYWYYFILIQPRPDQGWQRDQRDLPCSDECRFWWTVRFGDPIIEQPIVSADVWGVCLSHDYVDRYCTYYSANPVPSLLCRPIPQSVSQQPLLGENPAEMIKDLLWPEVNPCPLGVKRQDVKISHLGTSDTSVIRKKQ